MNYELILELAKSGEKILPTKEEKQSAYNAQLLVLQSQLAMANAVLTAEIKKSQKVSDEEIEVVRQKLALRKLEIQRDLDQEKKSLSQKIVSALTNNIGISAEYQLLAPYCQATKVNIDEHPDLVQIKENIKALEGYESQSIKAARKAVKDAQRAVDSWKEVIELLF